jgi:hypothetical protein
LVEKAQTHNHDYKPLNAIARFFQAKTLVNLAPHLTVLQVFTKKSQDAKAEATPLEIEKSSHQVGKPDTCHFYLPELEIELSSFKEKLDKLVSEFPGCCVQVEHFGLRFDHERLPKDAMKLQQDHSHVILLALQEEDIWKEEHEEAIKNDLGPRFPEGKAPSMILGRMRRIVDISGSNVPDEVSILDQEAILKRIETQLKTWAHE